MKTSLQWWNSIKNSPELINNWLLTQFYGEMSAHLRINSVLNSNIELSTKQRKALEKITKEELTHAAIFKNLTTEESYDQAKENHLNGLNALGLIL